MILALLASISISGTTVTLQPTTEPGAIAEVVMHNVNLNSGSDERDYGLEMDGLSVTITFDWEADGGSDGITITPPDGVLCQPSTCVLILPEGETGKVTLYEWVGF